MDIRHQPFDGALGDLLASQLKSGDYEQLDFMVAFAKQSGVLRLKSAFEDFRLGGGRIRAFVGIDLDGTSIEALASLLEITDELHVVHTESAMQTFHSKVFSLRSDSTVWVVVGSNNMTYPGLWANFESYAIESLRPGDKASIELEKRFSEFTRTGLRISMKISGIHDIEELRANGYVRSEMAINVEAGTRKRRRPPSTGLFGGTVPHSKGPALPAVPAGTRPEVPSTSTSPSASPTPPAVLAEWVGEIFWAESRKMTSAARNQLDLSMTGRVATGDAMSAGYGAGPGVAVGSVCYFGIDPTDQTQSRSVTIHYAGVDYSDNPVYFPDSEGANGTWRIQLNGADPTGARLDHRVGAGGFVKKILAFQRIDEDYYSLVILDEKYLPAIRLASSFSAHNGNTRAGKLYGVLTVDEQ